MPPIHRIATLDILRGFALMGIIFWNVMRITGLVWDSSDVEGTLYYLINLFIRYKFYAIFSFLFGFGFSILLMYSERKSRHEFYFTFIVRLLILFLIGWVHAVFFWFGDILRFYAFVGLFLLFFKGFSDRNLLIAAIACLCAPIIISIVRYAGDLYPNLTGLLTYSPADITRIMQQGGMQEFVVSNLERIEYRLIEDTINGRLFKILGLFLLGFYAGRKQLFHHVKDYMPFIKKYILWFWLYSLIANAVFLHTKQTSTILEEIEYVFAIYPFTFTYIITIIYLSQKFSENIVLTAMENLGRMSLTNYLAQTLIVAFVAMWYGFGMAGNLSFNDHMLLACFVIVVQCIWSYYWLKYFKSGPVEYVWRKAVNLIWKLWSWRFPREPQTHTLK